MKRNDPRHGTANGYSNLKCRCPRCREAWRVYFGDRFMKTPEYRARRRQRYAAAREAGFSPAEAKRRAFWGDPLRPS